MPSSATPSLERSATVLVVDDDPGLREALCMVLSDDGYEVALAQNGLEALDYLAKNDPPCVILLDLMMPLMDGFEVWDRLRAEPSLSSIPVLVLSAGALARAVGMVGAVVLKKPIALESLLDAVAARCRRSDA